MVMRKEEPDSQANLVPAPLSKANPPYPTTPLDEHPPAVPSSSGAPYSPDLNKSPAFNFKTLDDAKQEKDKKKDDSSDYSDDEWDRSDDEDDFEQVDARDVPDSLKPAGGKTPVKNGLPDVLRAGPPAGIPIKRSNENISPMPTGASSTSVGAMSAVSEQSNGSQSLQTNNPYLKMQPTGASNWGGETSQQIWGDSQGYAARYDEPVELPAHQTPSTPSHEMANLNLNNIPPVPTAQPPAPPVIAVNSPTPVTSPQSAQTSHDSMANPWNHDSDTATFGAGPSTHQPPQGSHISNSIPNQDVPVAPKTPPQQEQELKNDVSQPTPPKASSTNPFGVPPPPAAAPPLQPGSQPRAPSAIYEDEQPPALPPRRSQEEFPPAMPPRPIDTGVGSSVAPGPESPNTRMNRQRKEHYQIKHIRWHDVNKPGIRTSPILTQNLNGPCPLLALVNALVLSTPAEVESGLVETLRTRETVSLGLLLDAVFEELMSGRRGTAAQELPDVGDLYKFLLALHTGLNINPMFVPDSDATHGQASLTNSAAGQAGGFENTQDMKLYRTFNIPLMHGWLPEPNSEAAAAFNRVAKSYETSQYVQFQEEELDAKLQTGESLTADEQQMFTDIHAIKEFLNRWPTQLTDHGLKVLRNSFQSGQVAILFRNDHFSTLFKDPRTDKLLTLVTDQGYSSHDEIVWESLVDVHGQGSELFSGDFRPVGNHSAPPQQQQVQSLIDDDNQGWTTVESRRGNQQRPSSQNPTTEAEISSPTELSRTEQEDHDLALALQLQEEEEDRQRRENAQRDRDNAASAQTISAESNARPPNRRTSRGEQPPVIPPRRNNIAGHRPANEPAPPPTYEEASTARPYHPPQGHPANPQAPMPQQQGSAYMANSTNRPLPARPGQPMQGRPVGMPQNVGGRPGRRYSSGHGEEGREKCVVM